MHLSILTLDGIILDLTMFSNNRREKREAASEQSFKSSRFNFMNEDDTRYAIKGDLIDNVSSKLAANFTQIAELFTERKVLLLKKVERMYEENQNRIEAISRGRLQDLKNEAKLLRDESISSFIDNSDKLANTKNLLRKIIEQHSFAQFESMEKVKGKKYFDKVREAENQLNSRSKKYGILIQELEKINEKERGLFFEIEQLEAQMVAMLRRKEGDYLRKADQIQDEIDKRKSVLKDNKICKDKKKKDIEIILASLLDILNGYEASTLDRNSDIELLFGGNQNADDFELFIRQFQNLIEHKLEGKRDDRKEQAVQELIKLANSYEAYVQHFNKERQNEALLLEDIAEGLRSQVKTALIEKVYFQQISNDKAKLNEVLKKCKTYKNLLGQFQGERIKLNKQLGKISHMKSVFGPKLRSLVSEQTRKEELKKQLGQLIAYQFELEKMERWYKDFEFKDNSYLLAKQTVEREMDEYAQRGNLIEYKQKLKELERIEKELQQHRESASNNEYQRLQGRINAEAQALHAKYADLIDPILEQDDPITCSAFISKLSKRLALA